jgi:cation diffusion facilitator CzcD-associated flavoprotein CzcO
MGSSGIQVTSEIASRVGHLYTWIRSPTWITAGFAQDWAGPDGANFECELITQCYAGASTDSMADTQERRRQFEQEPLVYLDYCKQIESELNQRFKFILSGTPEAAQAKKVCICCVQ